MDSTRKQNLYLLSVLCAFGSALSQTDVHMVCPGDVWQPGENIQLECFVLKSSYPDKCTTFNSNQTIFRLAADGNSYQPNCTVNIYDACENSYPCYCEAGNTTHYKFVYNLTASKGLEGSWDCSVPCFAVAIPLTFSQYNCQNRKVLEIPPDLSEKVSNLETERNALSNQRSFVSATLGVVAFVAIILLGALVFFCFFMIKRLIFRLVGLNITIQQLSETADDVLKKIDGKQAVSITPIYNSENKAYLLIRSTNFIKLSQAANKMKSAIPGLEEVKDLGKESSDPSPDYPGSNASGR